MAGQHDAALRAVRSDLAAIPHDVSHSAVKPPDIRTIYAPDSHKAALDSDRVLVVGGRGSGKSFWAAALADPTARAELAQFYPSLNLDRFDVKLGFTGEDLQAAVPSPSLVRQQLDRGASAETIWRSVLLMALRSHFTQRLPDTYAELIPFVASNIEIAETALREADTKLTQDRRVLILVFDALDRLDDNWGRVRQLLKDLLRLGQQVRAYKSIRLKVFLRPDQAEDNASFSFADASKLKAQRVELSWSVTDLYGVAFTYLGNTPAANQGFRRIAESKRYTFKQSAQGVWRAEGDWLHRTDSQRALFNIIAGEFMGSDRRRGRTYSWLPTHLADANGQASPRVFLTALQRAAEHDPIPVSRAIDHLGLREGVRFASQVRLNQLEEDYPWVRAALAALHGKEVPCDRNVFLRAWSASGAIKTVRAAAKSSGRLPPVELEASGQSEEEHLLEALARLGVVEARSGSRVNVPDIYRVEARLKRRGGVKPPISPRRAN